MLELKDRDKHNLPCFDEECGGQSSCSLYNLPVPHLHCFKCLKQSYDEELIEEYRTTMDANLLKLISKDTEAKGNNLKLDRAGLFPQRGIVGEMEDRKISLKVAEKYGVEKLFNTETNEPYGYSFPAFNPQGLCAQKIKRFDKRMKWLYPGASIPKMFLFVQHLFPSGGKFITITEGEEDAQACYQMLHNSDTRFEPTVVSLNNGASTAERECKEHWEYINSFENIIICFDGDEQGKKAAEKVCRLFNYRPKVVLFPDAKKDETSDKWKFKDANDYLKEGKEKEFVNLWWKAEKSTPKGVCTMSSLWDSMIKQDSTIAVEWPWKGLCKKLRAMITGHFIVIKAPPKVGKTSIEKELAYHIHKTSEHNVGIIFLENTKKEIGIGLCALHMNKPLSPWDIPEDLSELQKAHEELSKDDRFMIFDPEDTRSVENIISKIIYFVKAHNCRFIFLDHITMLSYQSDDENERKFLDKLCADLKGLTTSLDICLIAVTHVNDDGKTRGSRASVQLCELMISLERDKTNPDPVIANTTNVIVEENRWGECGLACKLFYDQETGRLSEIDDSLVMEVEGGRQVTFDN